MEDITRICANLDDASFEELSEFINFYKRSFGGGDEVTVENVRELCQIWYDHHRQNELPLTEELFDDEIVSPIYSPVSPIYSLPSPAREDDDLIEELMRAYDPERVREMERLYPRTMNQAEFDYDKLDIDELVRAYDPERVREMKRLYPRTDDYLEESAKARREPKFRTRFDGPLYAPPKELMQKYFPVSRQDEVDYDDEDSFQIPVDEDGYPEGPSYDPATRELYYIDPRTGYRRVVGVRVGGRRRRFDEDEDDEEEWDRKRGRSIEEDEEFEASSSSEEEELESKRLRIPLSESRSLESMFAKWKK